MIYLHLVGVVCLGLLELLECLVVASQLVERGPGLVEIGRRLGLSAQRLLERLQSLCVVTLSLQGQAQLTVDLGVQSVGLLQGAVQLGHGLAVVLQFAVDDAQVVVLDDPAGLPIFGAGRGVG